MFTRKTLILAKKETTYGVDPTPTATANAIEAKNVTLTPHTPFCWHKRPRAWPEPHPISFASAEALPQKLGRSATTCSGLSPGKSAVEAGRQRVTAQ